MTDLDDKLILDRLNARIRLVRGWLSHDHRDDAFWTAHATSAPDAQRERATLRYQANLVHVARAHARGRTHGRFATVELQAAWLAIAWVETALHHLRARMAA